jgi:dolichol-phosphate mannosyltransferase
MANEKLGLVIPTLNEAANICIMLDRLRAELDRMHLDYELIVADDDSQDGTAQLVEKYSRLDPRIKLATRIGERGLAGAVIFGWKHTDANVLGVIDADLQHPPELLPKLVEAVLQGKDMAIGSRYVAGDGTAGWNFLRRWVSRAGTWITLPLQRREIRVRDPLSGFFVVRRRCIDGLDLQPQGFKLLLEILVRGNIGSVVEIPFQFGLRHAGASKANLRVGIEYVQLLGRLSRRALSRTTSS